MRKPSGAGGLGLQEKTKQQINEIYQQSTEWPFPATRAQTAQGWMFFSSVPWLEAGEAQGSALERIKCISVPWGCTGLWKMQFMQPWGWWSWLKTSPDRCRLGSALLPTPWAQWDLFLFTGRMRLAQTVPKNFTHR